MEKIFISVIIPIYNVKLYLSRCIKSVINQTYKDLEIILVDDGSTDGSQDICDEFQCVDDRITVIHQRNQGLVCARKAGLDIAKGKFVAFVDGDDWIEPDMYKEMLKELINMHSNIVLSGFYRNDKVGYLPDLGNIILTEENRAFLLRDFFEGKNLYHNIWLCLFEKELIVDAYQKVPNNMQYGEDAICFLHCLLAAEKMCWMKEAYYHYTVRAESMTHVSSMYDICKVWVYCAGLIRNAETGIADEEIDEWLNLKLFNILVQQTHGRAKHYQISDISTFFHKKIIIYGAGKVGIDYWKQMSNYSACQIVAWVDQNFEKISCPYRAIQDVETIKNVEFDVVLVAVASEETYLQIRQSLVQKGIDQERIIWNQPRIFFELKSDSISI